MAGYIGSKVAVVSSGAERKKVFTATSGQTSFTGLSYTVNNVHVFQNGVRLVDGTDYTATNGNSITLTVGAATDDQVVVVSYNTFQTSDTVSASTGGTFSNAVTIDADGATVLTVDRATSDGTIIDLQKGGSTVGSIGTSGNLLYMSSASGAGFRLVNDDLRPGAGSSNADAAYDLGHSNVRWRDLYLSGGVYLGGTGSANHLDDYEEGEFDVTATPISSGTVTLQSANNRASYTKVGRLVHCSGFFIVDSVSSPVGTELSMTLPFAAGQGGDQSLRVGMPIVHYDGSSDTVKPAIVIETQSILKIIIDCSTIASGDAFYYGFTYQAA